MDSRRNVPEFEILNLTDKELKTLSEAVKDGTAELVGRKGKLIGYSHSEKVDDLIMDHCKADKVKITKRMPNRYYDNGKKAVKITDKNIKEAGKMLKEIPDKYKPEDKEV